jgi:hypothetical protein
MALKTEDVTVLVVDDPLVRSFIRTLLERYGYTVVEANLARGLELVRTRETPVDILITNQPVPFAECGRDLALLYVAAWPEEPLARPFHRWRALRKPFKPQELLLALEDLMSEEAAAS